MPSIRTCSRWATISALVCGRGACWFWLLFGWIMFRRTDKVDSRKMQFFAVTITEIRTSEMSWKNYGRKGWHIDRIRPNTRPTRSLTSLGNRSESKSFGRSIQTHVRPSQSNPQKKRVGRRPTKGKQK